MLMDFKIKGLEKLDKLNLKLAREDFQKDMQQVNDYEEYIINSKVILVLMLNAYNMEIGQAYVS